MDSGPLEWLRAVYLAIVARDRAQVDLLAGVPVDLLRESVPRHNAYWFAWARTLQLYVRGEAGVVETVLEALRGTENLTPSTVPEVVNDLHLPFLELFYQFTQGDQAKFTAALITALDRHKRHWAREPRDPEGAVALAPLAVACLARDAGLAIEVQSDYLPHDLLVGTRAGQWRAPGQRMRELQRPVTKTVARHELDLEHADRVAAELTTRQGEVAMQLSFDEFGYRCVGDGRGAWNKTWLAMVRALQAGAARFLMATRPEGELVEFRYGEDVLHRPATGPTPECTALAWLRTTYLAIVARDQPRLDLLAGVPVDLLRSGDGSLVAWVRALQVFLRGEQGLVEAVLAAMRASDEAGNALLFSPMELFYRYTQREYLEFTKALVDALDLHKRHWAGEPRNPAGAVALGPLAMACLARDAGLPIDVESDYLPHHLLAGSRVGELTT